MIGIKPDEKVALFADNSCRWLVADQGMHLVSISLLSNIVWLRPSDVELEREDERREGKRRKEKNWAENGEIEKQGVKRENTVFLIHSSEF